LGRVRTKGKRWASVDFSKSRNETVRRTKNKSKKGEESSSRASTLTANGKVSSRRSGENTEKMRLNRAGETGGEKCQYGQKQSRPRSRTWGGGRGPERRKTPTSIKGKLHSSKRSAGKERCGKRLGPKEMGLLPGRANDCLKRGGSKDIHYGTY